MRRVVPAGKARVSLGICVILIAVAILLSLARYQSPVDYQPISIEPVHNDGFCADGAFGRAALYPGRPPNVRAWGSNCNASARGTGSLVTSSFPASRELQLYLAGYLANAGVSLQIERISDHVKFAVRPAHDPHEKWALYEFSLPESWQGSMVRLVADDQNPGAGAWLAFSEPIKTTDTGVKSAAFIFQTTVLHFILIILPCLAACVWAVYKGIRSVLTTGLLLLATVGALGYLIFWLYFFSPRVGHAAAFLLPVVAGIVVASVGRKLDIEARKTVKSLAPALALAGATALLVLSTGFLYGGLSDPLFTAGIRFSHPLPVDNALQFWFAESLRSGHVPKPLFLDWLSSDRPPLQTGIVLSQYPFLVRPRDRGYTVISVFAQSLWIFGLWLLLVALRVRREAIAVALATCLFSGFVFIHSFFVWPKLLAAAFLLGFFACLLADESALSRAEKRLRYTAGGALLAFALLSHGGAAFAVIGAVLTVFALKKRTFLLRLAFMLPPLVALYLPWTLYQKFVDPPGDRLLKYHLAGAKAIDPRPFIQALVSSYESLTIEQLIGNKLANGNTVIGYGHLSDYWTGIGALIRALIAQGTTSSTALQLAANIRAMTFFFFLPSLGFLCFGVFALLAGVKKRFRGKEWRASAIFLLLVGCSLFVWCLLMFGPGTTIIHSGALAVNLLASTALVLALWPLSPYCAVIVSGAQIALNVLIYLVLMRGPVPGGPLPEGYLRSGMLILCLLALGTVLYLLLLIAKSGDHGRPRIFQRGGHEAQSSRSREPSPLTESSP